MSDYLKFLQSKRRMVKPSGFKVDLEQINPRLLDFQKAITR